MRLFAKILSPSLLLIGSLAVISPATAQLTQIQYLSGTDKDHTMPWQFYMTGGGRSNNVSTTIPVPSCWQTKGFGNYSYQNNPSSVSVGQYGRVFSVPTNWAGQRIYLVYEGVLTDTATRINGQIIAGSVTNSTVAGSVTNPLPDDRALDNSAASAPGGTGGIALSTTNNTLNLGTLNQFTLTAWIKPVADFSTMSGSEFPRIIMAGATPGYDTSVTNGAALLAYNSGGTSAGLQFTVNTGNVVSPSGALTGNDWVFVAVTYDSTLANNNVSFYIGSRTATPVLFSTQTLLQGPVAFGTNAYAYLLNRSARVPVDSPHRQARDAVSHLRTANEFPHSGEYPIPYGKAPPEAVTPHPLTDVTDDLKVVASCGQIGDRTVPRSRSYFSMREGSYDLSLLRSSNWAVATRMARNVRSVSNVI